MRVKEDARLPRSDTKRRQGRTLAHPSVAATAPLVVGIGIAVLYGIGALRKMGQLDAAEVPADYALPLVSLPQLLTAGIQVAVTAVFFAPVGIAGGWIAIHAGRWAGRAAADWSLATGTGDQSMHPDDERTGRGGVEAVEPPRVRVVERVLAVIALVNAVILVVVAPWIVIPVLAVIVPILLRLRHRPLIASAAVYGVLLVGVTVIMYFAPSPLPTARVHTKAGDVIAGVLVASTGDGLLVGQAGRVVVTVPLDEVSRVWTHTPPYQSPPSLLWLVRDAMS